MKLFLYISFLLLPFISMGQFSLVMTPGITPIVYATWNPSDAGSAVTLSGGNLIATINPGPSLVRSTIGKTSGKWYWEITITSVSPNQNVPGIAYIGASNNSFAGDNASSWGIYDAAATIAGGGYIYNALYVGTGYLNYTTGDVLGFALDMGAQTLSITKNNVAMGSLITGLSGGAVYAVASIAANNGILTANFGASPFAGTVPTGYNAGLY
jgi:hypothetical protein